jgi:hypothetical protein
VGTLFVLVAALSLLLVACGGGSDDAIDSAASCAEPEAEMHLAVADYGSSEDEQERWESEVLHRVETRYL